MVARIEHRSIEQSAGQAPSEGHLEAMAKQVQSATEAIFQAIIDTSNAVSKWSLGLSDEDTARIDRKPIDQLLPLHFKPPEDPALARIYTQTTQALLSYLLSRRLDVQATTRHSKEQDKALARYEHMEWVKKLRQENKDTAVQANTMGGLAGMSSLLPLVSDQLCRESVYTFLDGWLPGALMTFIPDLRDAVERGNAQKTLKQVLGAPPAFFQNKGQAYSMMLQGLSSELNSRAQAEQEKAQTAAGGVSQLSRQNDDIERAMKQMLDLLSQSIRQMAQAR